MGEPAIGPPIALPIEGWQPMAAPEKKMVCCRFGGLKISIFSVIHTFPLQKPSPPLYQLSVVTLQLQNLTNSAPTAPINTPKIYTLSGTNSSPLKNWWLGNYFPFGFRPIFHGRLLLVLGRVNPNIWPPWLVGKPLLHPAFAMFAGGTGIWLLGWPM